MEFPNVYFSVVSSGENPLLPVLDLIELLLFLCFVISCQLVYFYSLMFLPLCFLFIFEKIFLDDMVRIVVMGLGQRKCSM